MVFEYYQTIYDMMILNPDPPVDIVTVDGVDVVLHDLVTHSLGHARGDVTQVMNDTGLCTDDCVYLLDIIFSPHN